MARSIVALMLLIALVAAVMPPAVPAQAQTTETPQPFVRLPKSCITGTPGNNAGPVCCIFGHVFLDGEAVSQAVIRLKNLANNKEIEIGTFEGPDSPLPYYQANLSQAPLSMSPGDTLGITVFYASHTTYQTFVVQGGGQQLDLVIAKNGAVDYTFERQIWQQDPPEVINLFHDDVAVDGAGQVYLTEWTNGRVKVFSPSGKLIRTWGTLGSTLGRMLNPSGITVDNRGFVYVSDAGGLQVHKFTTSGEWVASFAEFGTANQFGFPRGIVTDNSFLYVVDERSNRVQKLSLDGEYIDRWGSEGGGNGQLRAPSGIALGADGRIYVADTGNNRVQVFDRNGGFIRIIGSAGSSAGQLNAPERVAVAANGDVYVSDTGNHRVQIFSSTGQVKSAFGRYGNASGEMDRPGGLAFDGGGRLYLVDTSNARVQVFSAPGSVAAIWSGSQFSDQLGGTSGVALGADGRIYVLDLWGIVFMFDRQGRELGRFGGRGGGDGELSGPEGLEVGPDGAVYVADTENHRVQVFTADGVFLRTLGSRGTGNGQFESPFDVAVDGVGNVYVADDGNSRIQKFTPQGSFLWATGSFGAGTGQFNGIYGIDTDTGGNLYATDQGNHRVQQFNSSGVFLRAWGSQGGGNGQLNQPTDVSIGPDGVVFVADRENYRVARFTSTGMWLSNWGSTSVEPGSFNQPGNLTVGPDGRIYTAERNLGRVQILRPIIYTDPIATIVSASPLIVSPGQPVALRGMGARSVAGSGPLAYEWSLDGASTPFAITQDATLNTDGLAIGSHTVVLSVRDGAQRSPPRSVTLSVLGTGTVAAPRAWTFLLYMAGDNPDIVSSLDGNSQLGALYRLVNAPSNPRVSVAILFDGDGPNDSVRYLLRPGAAPVQERLAEQNMGNPSTLVEFVRWGRAQAPSDATYLAIANHGNAIDGIAWDRTSAADNSERLSPSKLEQALIAIAENSGGPLDVLHLDACLMGLLEVAYQARGLARQLIVSENQAWSVFAYERYMAAVGEGTTPATLAASIADIYRSKVTTDRLPYTISVLDMGQLERASRRADDFAGELLRYALAGPENRAILSQLRAQAQKFDSGNNGRITADDEYVDLDHFAQLVQGGVSDAGVIEAATQLRTALGALVAVNHRSSGLLSGAPANLAEARGVAIFYPPRPGYRTYSVYRNELSFAADTRWDEFLQAQLAALSPEIEAVPPPNPAAPLPFGKRIWLPLLRR